MLLAYLAFVAPIRVTGQSATVTYSNPGARLQQLLPELSKSCRQALTASPAMRDEVLAVRLDHTDTAQAMAKIAYATWGVWRKDGESSVLEQDVEALNREKKRIADDYREVIHRTLLGLQSRIRSDRPSSDEFGRPVGPPSPAEIAIAKLVPSLDEAAIAALPVGREIVYSTNPRPLQHRLPVNAEAIFENMISELQRVPVPKARARVAAPLTPRPVPAKTILVVRRSPFPFGRAAYAGPGGPPGLDMLITVYDAAGKAVVSESVFTPCRQPSAPPPIPAAKPQLVRQSDLTRSFLHYWPGPWRPTPESQDRLLTPIEHDPAGWFGSVLADYAASMNRQMVVAVSDEEISDIGSMPAEDLTDLFLRATILNGGATIDDSWITMRRRLPHPEDTEPAWIVTDRHRLQDLVKAPPDPKLPLFWQRIAALRAGYDPRVALPQWGLLELEDWAREPAEARLALLTDAQLALLLSGGKLPLSETPVDFREAFAADMAKGPDGIENSMGPSFGTGRERFERTRDARGEYTEVAYSYLPSTAYVYLCVETRHDVFVAAPGKGGAGGWANPFPFAKSARLAIGYCIKPGFNVLGPSFRFGGA